MIVSIATIQARSETADAVAEALRHLAEQTRSEPGCLSYHVHRGLEDPTLLVTVDEWRTAEELQRHFEMPYVKELVAQAPALLAAEPVIRSFTRL
jgi:quinol monooxygenase YgiN